MVLVKREPTTRIGFVVPTKPYFIFSLTIKTQIKSARKRINSGTIPVTFFRNRTDELLLKSRQKDLFYVTRDERDIVTEKEERITRT